MSRDCRAGCRTLRSRGVSYLELLSALALLAILLAAVIIPSYRTFSAQRAAREAAITLAEDIALLQRSAQNGSYAEGSSLVVNSVDPLSYVGYHGRPSDVDPASKLGAPIVTRTFQGVALAGGPINGSTPLLFASNGSAQYVASGSIANQHQVIAVTLAPSGGASRIATVELNLYTGAVNIP